MFFTYVIQNSHDGKYYIGCTNDIIRRLSEHNRGQNPSTKRDGRWGIKYMEEFADYASAQKRERIIKSYKGGNAFKNLMQR